MKPFSFVFALTILCASPGAWGGLEEGLDAYDEGMYQAALHEFLPLANQGDARAQYQVGHMYSSGKGVPQNHQEAIKWYSRAAVQGMADAQANLGSMYGNGQGVPKNNIVAYALSNVSTTRDPSSSNEATRNRTLLTQRMTVQEIRTGQILAQEMMKPGNLLRALDGYLKSNPTTK